MRMAICQQIPKIFSTGERSVSQFLNVQRVSNVRQMEIHTAKPLVYGHSPFEFDNATAKLKRYKLPSIDQVPAQLTSAGDEILP
jgi:hypothetical protein